MLKYAKCWNETQNQILVRFSSLLSSSWLCYLQLISSLLYSSLVSSPLLYSSLLFSMCLCVCVCLCVSQAVEKSSVTSSFCLKRIPSRKSVCPCEVSGKKHATTNKTGSSRKSHMDTMNFPAAQHKLPPWPFTRKPCLHKLSLVPGCQMLLAFQSWCSSQL